MTGRERMEKAKQIYREINPAHLPETAAYLGKLTEEDDLGAFEMATALAGCDKATSLPRALFDFLVELYKEAAAGGSAAALNDLGALYYDGRGCEQDYEKAVFYYESAARLGDRQAQENLGYCYYYGRSVPVDYKKAFHYFALGAFDGHLISLYKIGDMYQNGYYVEKNPIEAFHIYERCAETMSDEAAPSVAGPVFLRLGNCFLNGIGVEPNAKTALLCFQRAEAWLFDMVSGGDTMYTKSLQNAIDGQTKAREKLRDSLPEKRSSDGQKVYYV